MFLEHLLSSNPASAEGMGTDFITVREELICTTDVFELLATYLCETYIIESGRINAGKHLAEKSAIGLWRGLIQQTVQRFPASESAQTKVRARAFCTHVCAHCTCTRSRCTH